MTPLDFGRDLNSSGLGVERSGDSSTVIGLWASGSDKGESRVAEANWNASDSELEGSTGSEHQVGSEASWGYQSYCPMARRAMSGIVGKAKGEPSRVGYIVRMEGDGS